MLSLFTQTEDESQNNSDKGTLGVTFRSINSYNTNYSKDHANLKKTNQEKEKGKI